MITIKIHEEVSNNGRMVDLLRHIAGLIEEGFIKGHYPGWELKGEEESEEESEEE